MARVQATTPLSSVVAAVTDISVSFASMDITSFITPQVAVMVIGLVVLVLLVAALVLVHQALAGD
jgi:hypothetical protein